MPATTIFSWLIWIFGGIAIAGLLMGVYSVTAQCHFKNSDKIGKIAMWLFLGFGIVAMICGIIRITLGFVK